MKLLIGIQARSASTRLPGKIYEKIGGKSVLKWVYDAAVDAKRMLDDKKEYEFSDVVILTPFSDERLKVYCAEQLIPFKAPECPEDDLVSRYHLAMKDSKADALLRLTADCPFHVANLLFECARNLKIMDYVTNTKERSFFEGLDTQGIKKRAMEWINKHQKKNREHPFFDLEHNYEFEGKFAKEGFTIMNLLDPQNVVSMKTSIDTLEDLERARRMHSKHQKSLK